MSFDSDIEDEEIKKPKDEFDKMKDLINEAFEYRKCIPAYISSINPTEDKYKEVILDCKLKIPTPRDEISRAQMNVSALIEDIDNTYIAQFKRLQNLIDEILTFIGKYHILYVHTTNNRYQTIPINEEAQKQFLAEAEKLDDKIKSEVPTAQDPIIRIIKEMKFDSSVKQAQKYIKTLKEKLTEVYRTGMAEIFKYIVLGEEV